MSSYAWSDLRVVVVDGLYNSGVAIRYPFIRTPGGSVFVLQDVHEERPEVNPEVCRYVTKQDLATRTALGLWFAVPGEPTAQKDHVLLVRSKKFADISAEAGVTQDLPFLPLSEGCSVSYVLLRQVEEWRLKCRTALLAWSRKTLLRSFHTQDRDLLTKVRRALGQTLYVCDHDLPERLELHILFGIVLQEFLVSEPQWSNFVRMVCGTTTGFGSVEDFERRLAELRAELTGSSCKP